MQIWSSQSHDRNPTGLLPHSGDEVQTVVCGTKTFTSGIAAWPTYVPTPSPPPPHLLGCSYSKLFLVPLTHTSTPLYLLDSLLKLNSLCFVHLAHNPSRLSSTLLPPESPP